MSHVPPEVLTLRAFDEPVSADVRAHLAGCEVCGAEVATLRRTVAVARESWSEAPPPAPPAALWDRIVAGLSDDDAAALGPITSDPGPRELPAPDADADRGTPSGGASHDAAGSAHRAEGSVVELRPHQRRAWWAAAAAVAAFAIGGVATIAVQQPGSTVLASTELEALADVEPGQARLVETPEGLAIEVDVTGLPEVDGFYELWLLDTEVTSLVSLGPLEGAGPHLLPAGLDPAELPVVDISLEPFDGDPNHSGDSLLRGVLDELDGADRA
jgi:hypothetical protein